MTCLIQLASPKHDYILDAIQLRTLICKEIKPLLESPNYTKIVFASDNDMINLNRDFMINAQQVFDLQLFMKECMKRENLETLIRFIPNYKLWFINNIMSGLKNPELLFQEHKNRQTAQQQYVREGKKLGYKSFVRLFYPDVDLDKTAQLADWRIRKEPSFALLKTYAADDVHYLLKIHSYLSNKVRI